jgi:hypothetical protein
LLLVLAGLTLFADVFIRRVAIPVNEWIGALRKRLTRRDTGAEAAASIQRLKSKKSEIEREVEAQRGQLRFEPEEPAGPGSGREQLTRILAEERERELEPPPVQAIEDPSKPSAADEGYTSRLLDAKRKAQKRRDGEEKN